jgi:hypothetical protein
MEQRKILGIPYTEFGNQIKIAGIVLQGNDESQIVYFPEARLDSINVSTKLDHEGWKELMFQLDVQEVVIIDPTKGHQKSIFRKSQREIEHMTNWNVFRRDNYTCRYCGNNKTPLSVDHVVLWEHMGATVEDNLITACRNCNKTRGSMLFEDWLNSDYYKKVRVGISVADGIKNERVWEVAKALPLRTSKRTR